MLKAYGSIYAIIAAALRKARGDVFAWALLSQEAVIGPAEKPHTDSITAMEMLLVQCGLLPLGKLREEVARAIKEHKGGTIADRLGVELDRLYERLKSELRDHHFLYVAPGLSPFYGDKEPFGAKVAKKFPKASEDLTQAGNCIALHQPVACVFHLMRGMEVAVRKLGPRIGVIVDHKTTWVGITKRMNGAILRMPDGTKRQRIKKDAWEAASANLHNIGSVWRNKTMHPAKTYTSRQAMDIYDAVRVSMQSLCEL